MERNAATIRQIEASRPDRSTWLSANAGSGKTKVLTDRVARLLLNGVEPQNVLCLTYTKAAASEMQNRLFKRLGEWAMLPDPNLVEALQTLGHGDVITNDVLPQARRLFARAIETPGGLKIQTIHSFCSALLRKFPFEAGVTPNFVEMEDRSAAQLRTEITETLAGGEHRAIVEKVAPFVSGATLEDLTDSIAGHRVDLEKGLDEVGMCRLLNIPVGFSEEDLLSAVFLGNEENLLANVIQALEQSSTNDQKAAEKLRRISTFDVSGLEVLEGVFLYGPSSKTNPPYSAKVGSFPTKSCQNSMADLMPALNELMSRVEEGRDKRLELLALQRSKALNDFATVFLDAYERAKMLRGWLDFDDLIFRARDLLKDPQVADWVLYRLDGRIDHILVDEAQDTSPAQWDVIECLAREFTSGQGTKDDTPRTIFVVGDKKQSIYSFQGADPREFDRMKEEFGARLQNTVSPLQSLQMDVSFRSAPSILSLVDAVFEERFASGFDARQQHVSFKTDLPGRVDLWGVVEKPDQPEDPPWFDPVDVKQPDNPNAVLARNVAAFIKDTIGQPLPGTSEETARAISPGDFLILVRRRSEIFHDIIRECKSLGLPVAGADRLKVGAELAVKDIRALLSVLATPEDDLSLAAALRSPLFGWSENDLFKLAHDRKQRYLYAELRDRADAYPETTAILDDLRDHVDFLRPFDLIDRILTRHEGRRKLLGRLGIEAEDGLDALLTQGLAYERESAGSLTGFLVWMETDELEIKRQLDTAGDRIRVMTVHGAKGLEAPIVILPDTAKWPLRSQGEMVCTESGVLWRSNADQATKLQKQFDDAARQASIAERDRLLYVGMTRAEQWLVVAAAGDLERDGQSWYDKVRFGMTTLDAKDAAWPWTKGLRLENGEWKQKLPDLPKTSMERENVLPAYFREQAVSVSPVTTVLSPSNLGGAKALPDEKGLDEAAAKRRGRQLHKLLEVLPGVEPNRWEAVTDRLLSHGEEQAGPEECAMLLSEVRKVLEKPSLASLFSEEALTEVPISADIDVLGGRRIHGVIDRLLVSETDVLAIDFKTNAMVPILVSECPDGLLRQMGAYSHALAKIYPERTIKTAILWTRTATLMHLPHDLVTDALRNTHIP
jgi:ATP-dependent helicase/nuclease subunit A